MISFFNYLHAVLIKPLSNNEDTQRREAVLNILLCGSVGLSALAILRIVIDIVKLGSAYRGAPLIAVAIPFFFFGFLLILSRVGYYKVAAHILVFTYLLIGTYTLYRWGNILPAGLMVYVLTITIASAVIGAEYSLFATFMVFVALIIVTYLQQSGVIHPNMYWIDEAGGMEDAIVYTFMLSLVAIIAWLGSKELDRSLHRAVESEAALREQRDQLEHIVDERTRELKQAQQEEILRLYQFAELGKLTSSLIHDLVNPLTTISLNLEKLGNKQNSQIIQRASDGAKRMEHFIEMARGEIRNQRSYHFFSANLVIQQTIDEMRDKLKEKKIKIIFTEDPNVQLYGNSLKFHELVVNLINNALDAYEDVETKDKSIQIFLTKRDRLITLTVQDNGKGIAPTHLTKIFDPFFTTKNNSRSLGLGLSIVKDIIEKDFSGSITATSKKSQGTRFIVALPLK